MVAENFPGGYAGKIARIDLTSGNVVQEELNEIFYRKYIGGAGFVAHYLYNEMKPHIDPLGPENMLVFALGPVTGVTLPGRGRHCFGAKSPLTGGIAKSEVGEFWGAELKRAGFDALIITGKSPKPIYLWIKDNEIAIKEASHVWGKITGDTQAAIRQELGDPAYRTIKSILEKGLDQEMAIATGVPVSAGAFLRGPQELFASIAEARKEVF